MDFRFQISDLPRLAAACGLAALAVDQTFLPGTDPTDVIQLTDDPIDVSAVLDGVRRPAAGAVVLFLGTVRETTGGRKTSSLQYECYAEMAEKKLAELEAEARGRWPLEACVIVHRLGHLPVGETSVAIALSAAHRRPAFEAGQWLIDRVKEVVPIWKKENYVDGTSDWVHPAADRAKTSQE